MTNDGSEFGGPCADRDVEIAGEMKLDLIERAQFARLGFGFAAAEGSADIKLSGKTGQFLLSVAGSADVSAFDLSADDVSISISGSGDAEVNAGDSLSVSIKGSGDVSYSGEPTVSKSIMGNGDVHRRR